MNPSVSLDREHLELLLGCSRLLSSSLDLRHVLGTLMDQAVEVLGAERGMILMFDQDGGGWTTRTVRSLDTATIQSEEFRFSRGVVEQVIHTGQSLLTSDALEDERLRESASVNLYSLRSVLCVPLASSRPLGVIYLDNRLTSGAFGEREQRMLEAIASQAAVSLENALLYEQLNLTHETRMEQARQELTETQAQLHQAARMAEVGQMAAGVAHEITNPLGSISQSLKALQESTGDSEALRRLELVSQATERCRSLLAQLLPTGGEQPGPVANLPAEALRTWVEGMAVLVESATAMSGLLEENQVLSNLQRAAERLLGGTGRGLEVRLIPKDGLSPLALRVAEAGSPVLIDDLTGTEYQLLAPGRRSLLALPLAPGLLLATLPEAGRFQRLQQDLLVLLGFQVSSTLEACRLHRQSQESYARLIHSSKLAAVGQLAAGMAHELNTPLASVMLSLDSAVRQLQSRPESAAQKIDRARQTLKNAQAIVEKLLYYSRDAGKGRKNCQLSTIVEDTLTFMHAPLLKDGVTVRVEPGGQRDVFCNPNEIQQILTNLLLNARDALIAAGRAREPIVLRLTAEGNSVGVVVEDRGPGIAPEVQTRIFDPFFTTKEAGKGTGLGLSISQEIALLHGGQLSFASSPRGTAFRLSLPAV